MNSFIKFINKIIDDIGKNQSKRTPNSDAIYQDIGTKGPKIPKQI